MESMQVIERLASGAVNPFSFEGSLWVVWFLIGIVTLSLDLSKKARLGLLSIAAFVTVFTSFALPVASQILVFGFLGLSFTVAEHAHKQHQQRTKHMFVH